MTLTKEFCEQYVVLKYGSATPARLAERQLAGMVLKMEEYGCSWFYDEDLKSIGYDDLFIKIYGFVRENKNLFNMYLQ